MVSEAFNLYRFANRIFLSMTLIAAAKRLTRRFPADRAGWVSATPLSLVVVVGALLSIRSHFLLHHDRELVVHSKEAMDRIRAVTRQITQSEEQLLTARSVEVHHDEQRIIVIIILTTLVSTLLRVAIAAWRQSVTKVAS